MLSSKRPSMTLGARRLPKQREIKLKERLAKMQISRKCSVKTLTSSWKTLNGISSQSTRCHNSLRAQRIRLGARKPANWRDSRKCICNASKHKSSNQTSRVKVACPRRVMAGEVKSSVTVILKVLKVWSPETQKWVVPNRSKHGATRDDSYINK